MIEEIMALREQESFRYRDVAIVTGNMDIYGTLIKGEMERKGMPCFIDQKKSILANPVVDTISSMLDVLRKDFDYESMIKLLKSGFIQRTGCPTNGIKSGKMLCSFWTIFCWHLEFEGTKTGKKNGTPDMFFEERQKT